MYKILFILLATVLSGCASLNTKTVSYDNNKFEGYLAMPKKIDHSKPAILMIHNWMGVTEETKFQANRFAEQGYVVFAADIYGKGQRPKDQSEAGKFAGKYKRDRKLFRQNLNTGLDFLKTLDHVDSKNLVVAGYCFGGTGAIELARSGAAVKGAISFHGGLDSPTPKDGKKIKAKILALHGNDDPFVPAKDLAAFEKEMKKYKVNYNLIKYPNAVHSFTDKGAGNDNSKGAAYNAEADKKSFAEALSFLQNLSK